MDSSTYTILGWTVTLGMGGVFWYYYTHQDGRRRAFQGRGIRHQLPRAAATPPPGEVRTARDRRRDRALGQDAGQGSDSDARRRQARAATDAAPVRSSFIPVNGENEVEDLSWAQELANRKKGTSLAPPTRADNQQRTVKQSIANKATAETSSSTGGDADDDLSPAVSPSLDAFSAQGAPSGKSVTDMLEAPASGPSVLKLTESAEPTRSRAKQQTHVTTEQETKKQRQNRKKAEEKKAQREADEMQRRALEEKQRRAAREARGEPAKNGLGISSAPTSNAWKASNHVAAAPIPGINGQLLDTFANDTTSTESTAQTSDTSSPVNGNKKWWNGHLPSE